MEKEEKILYFSHSPSTYGSPEEKHILEDLVDLWPEYKIINPRSLGIPGTRTSCYKCMDEFMRKVCFPWIEKSSILALWAPVSTCSTKCEMYFAGQLGKELMYITYHPQEIEYEDITLKEYHCIDLLMEPE